MDIEQSEENEWEVIEETLRFIYGDKAYQRITSNSWWREAYYERREKLEKQIERQKITRIKPLLYAPIGASQEKLERINRKNGQRSRWFMAKFDRIFALERMGRIDCVERLLAKMSWHPHWAHIWAVANYPGVTSQQLTDNLSVSSSNHRMVFRRLNNDLYRVGWQFVSSYVTAENESWGWYLEKI